MGEHLCRTYVLRSAVDVAGAGIGVSGSNMWPTTQTLAGPHASGRWTGLQCGFANYSGVLAATLTGMIVGRTGHFAPAFAVAMGFGLLGAACWVFIVGPIELVVWPRQTPREALPKISGDLAPGPAAVKAMLDRNRT